MTDELSLDPQVWLCIRYGWVVVVGAALCCGGCVLFCVVITFNIVLFDYCKDPVGVFILVSFNVDENWFQWHALPCHVTNCQIKIPVICCHIVGTEVHWSK